MKYSFTLSMPFLNASRQPSNRSWLLIFLRICSRMSSRATSGASVMPECRSVPISEATTLSASFTRRLGNAMLTPSGPNTSFIRRTSGSKYG